MVAISHLTINTGNVLSYELDERGEMLKDIIGMLPMIRPLVSHDTISPVPTGCGMDGAFVHAFLQGQGVWEFDLLLRRPRWIEPLYPMSMMMERWVKEQYIPLVLNTLALKNTSKSSMVWQCLRSNSFAPADIGSEPRSPYIASTIIPCYTRIDGSLIIPPEVAPEVHSLTFNSPILMRLLALQSLRSGEAIYAAK